MPDLFAQAICRGCGCTDDHACPGGCFWVEPGLCSSCDDGVAVALGLRDDLLDRDAADLGALTDDACPDNPLGSVHQVIWTGATDGYCVHCRMSVHG